MKIYTGLMSFKVSKENNELTIKQIKETGDSLEFSNGKKYKNGDTILKKNMNTKEYDFLKSRGFIIKDGV